MEHTFLLHVPAPGAPPKVLYWYRTAPGLRIGRPALDDAAMRAIEERYPDIDFDWPYILDMGAMTPVEVEAPLPPRKRRTRPSDADEQTEPGAETEPAPPPPLVATDRVDASNASAPGPDLLADLVGRGIATSLRGRYADLRAMVEASGADEALKDVWRARLAPLDPDGWTTPEAVLAGMSTAEPLLDALRRDVQPPSAS